MMLLTANEKGHPPTAKEKILHAAHHLFYACGIKATGIDRIIEASQVTKVTFYRHFPSKNTLILSYLEYRHRLWIEWFSKELAAHPGRCAEALAATLYRWFSEADFRGCAFINATAESGELIDDIKRITRNHKQEMMEIISRQFALSDSDDIESLALLIDGAIVQAQMGRDPLQVTTRLRHTAGLILSA